MLALDIGGSHVAAAVVDAGARRVLPQTVVHVAVHHEAPAEELLCAWASAGKRAAERAPEPSLLGVGVAMPSPFDYGRGIAWQQHKFASLYGCHVGSALRVRWAGTTLADLPLHFANDAGLFTLGEAWAGAGQDAHRVLGVTLGTGLGSGFVDRGRLLDGGRSVPPEGQLWRTPYRGGVAEDAVSTHALTTTYQTATGRVSRPRDIAQAAQAGEVEARQVFQELGVHLAAILAPWVISFRPRVVVLGGNVARAWPLFWTPLTTPFRGEPEVDFRVSELFENAAFLGAAALIHLREGCAGESEWPCTVQNGSR